MSEQQNDTAKETMFGDPTGGPTAPDIKSIVDTMFDLDEFLSGDIRRAELDAKFSVKPHLEAVEAMLNAELDSLTDSQGRPLEDPEQSLVGHDRSASVVMSELAAVKQERAEANKWIRLRAMSEDEWAAFEERHKRAIGDGSYPVEYWEELISESAIKPKMTVEEVRLFRGAASHAVYSLVGNMAYRVNTMAGVSIPKSLLS